MIRALVTIVLLAAATASVWHRAEYKNWPWQGAPLWLSYCDRTYTRAEPERPQPREAQLRETFRAPPVVGRRVLVSAGDRCGDEAAALGIHRDAGNGRVVSYGLQGGP